MATDYLVKAGGWMTESHSVRSDRPTPEQILQENLCGLGDKGWDLIAVAPDGRGHVLWVFKKAAVKRVTQRSFNAGEFGETQA
jgi:hypothetical protein